MRGLRCLAVLLLCVLWLCVPRPVAGAGEPAATHAADHPRRRANAPQQQQQQEEQAQPRMELRVERGAATREETEVLANTAQPTADPFPSATDHSGTLVKQGGLKVSIVGAAGRGIDGSRQNTTIKRLLQTPSSEENEQQPVVTEEGENRRGDIRDREQPVDGSEAEPVEPTEAPEPSQEAVPGDQVESDGPPDQGDVAVAAGDQEPEASVRPQESDSGSPTAVPTGAAASEEAKREEQEEEEGKGKEEEDDVQSQQKELQPPPDAEATTEPAEPQVVKDPGKGIIGDIIDSIMGAPASGEGQAEGTDEGGQQPAEGGPSPGSEKAEDGIEIVQDEELDPTEEELLQDSVGGNKINYAKAGAGAVVVRANEESQNKASLLRDDRDSYFMSPCAATKFFDVQLSDEITVTDIVIANYERFASVVKDFRILGSQSYPASKWMALGNFTATDQHGEQTFHVEPTARMAMIRYLRFRWLSHHRSEYYCTLSGIRVHGYNAMMSLHKEMHRRSLGEEDEEEEDDDEAEKDEFGEQGGAGEGGERDGDEKETEGNRGQAKGEDDGKAVSDAARELDKGAPEGDNKEEAQEDSKKEQDEGLTTQQSGEEVDDKEEESSRSSGGQVESQQQTGTESDGPQASEAADGPADSIAEEQTAAATVAVVAEAAEVPAEAAPEAATAPPESTQAQPDDNEDGMSSQAAVATSSVGEDQPQAVEPELSQPMQDASATEQEPDATATTFAVEPQEQEAKPPDVTEAAIADCDDPQRGKEGVIEHQDQEQGGLAAVPNSTDTPRSRGNLTIGESDDLVRGDSARETQEAAIGDEEDAPHIQAETTAEASDPKPPALSEPAAVASPSTPVTPLTAVSDPPSSSPSPSGLEQNSHSEAGKSSTPAIPLAQEDNRGVPDTLPAPTPVEKPALEQEEAERTTSPTTKPKRQPSENSTSASAAPAQPRSEPSSEQSPSSAIGPSQVFAPTNSTSESAGEGEAETESKGEGESRSASSIPPLPPAPSPRHHTCSPPESPGVLAQLEHHPLLALAVLRNASWPVCNATAAAATALQRPAVTHNASSGPLPNITNSTRTSAANHTTNSSSEPHNSSASAAAEASAEALSTRDTVNATAPLPRRQEAQPSATSSPGLSLKASVSHPPEPTEAAAATPTPKAAWQSLTNRTNASATAFIGMLDSPQAGLTAVPASFNLTKRPPKQIKVGQNTWQLLLDHIEAVGKARGRDSKRLYGITRQLQEQTSEALRALTHLAVSAASEARKAEGQHEDLRSYVDEITASLNSTILKAIDAGVSAAWTSSLCEPETVDAFVAWAPFGLLAVCVLVAVVIAQCFVTCMLQRQVLLLQREVGRIKTPAWLQTRGRSAAMLQNVD